MFTVKTARLTFIISLIGICVLAFSPSDGLPSFSNSDKVKHLIAFAFLTWLGHRAFPSRLIPLFCGLTFYACFIEFVQHFLPNRQADIADIIADMAGILLAWLLLRHLAKIGTSR